MSAKEKLFPLEGERVMLVSEAAGRATIIRKADGAAVGHVLIEDEDGVLFVRELCIEGVERGFGLGSEAANLMRKAAERGHWHTLRAWAPPDLGLAVYFWFRTGLHPLGGPGPDGGIALERRLKQ